MRALIRGLRRHTYNDGGFTLVELVMTVAIVGIISAGLAGVVISYLKTTVATEARLTESHDVQFTDAYWQRDVSSIGVRSASYNTADDTFDLQQSVWPNGVGAACTLPAGTPVVTLGWSEYDSLDSEATPKRITVTYLAELDSGRYRLTRVRCTDSTKDSEVEVAHNLDTPPTISCQRAAGGTNCTDGGANVPTIVRLHLSVEDPDDHGTSGYESALVGERRQTS